MRGRGHYLVTNTTFWCHFVSNCGLPVLKTTFLSSGQRPSAHRLARRWNLDSFYALIDLLNRHFLLESFWTATSRFPVVLYSCAATSCWRAFHPVYITSWQVFLGGGMWCTTPVFVHLHSCIRFRMYEGRGVLSSSSHHPVPYLLRLRKWMLPMPNMKSLPSIFYSPSIGYERKDSFRTSTNMGLSKTSWNLVTIYVAAYTLTEVAVANLHLSKNSHYGRWCPWPWSIDM